MITILGGYFLVKFSFLEDYNHANYEGPWMGMDHYLIVKECYPNFDPEAIDVCQDELKNFQE